MGRVMGRVLMAALMPVFSSTESLAAHRFAFLVPGWVGVMPRSLEHNNDRRGVPWGSLRAGTEHREKALCVGGGGLLLEGGQHLGGLLSPSHQRCAVRGLATMAMQSGPGGAAARFPSRLSTTRKLDVGVAGVGIPERGMYRNQGPDCTSALVAGLQECGVLPAAGDPAKLARLFTADALVFALSNDIGVGATPDDPWTPSTLLLAAAHIYKVKVVCTDDRLWSEVFIPPDGVQPVAEIGIVAKEDGFYVSSSSSQLGSGALSAASPEGLLWIFFDLETTGLDTDKDNVVQIAATAYHTFPACGRATLRGHFNCLVKPGVPVSSGAAAVTGLTTEILQPYPTFDQQGRLFLDWMRRLTEETRCPAPILVAHNGLGYDFPLLKSELRRHSLDASIVDRCRLMDTVIFYRESGSRQNKLGEIFQRRFGRPMSGAHDARVDVAALARITVRWHPFPSLVHAKSHLLTLPCAQFASESPSGHEDGDDLDVPVPEELEVCSTRVDKLVAWLSMKRAPPAPRKY